MKAEHRKELQTNVLADRLGRLLKGVQSGPPRAGTIAWFVVLAAILIGGGWYYFRGTSTADSALWVQLDANQDPESLKRLADEHPNTPLAHAALFQRARILLGMGLAGLYPESAGAPDDQTKERTRATQQIDEARRAFESLAKNAGDDSLLAQEAWIGAGKAEEALVQVPKPEKAGESYGSLARAIEFYRNALSHLPAESTSAQTLSRHVAELEKNGKDVEDFYANLTRIAEAEAKRAK